jgi:hypothetical protein
VLSVAFDRINPIKRITREGVYDVKPTGVAMPQITAAALTAGLPHVLAAPKTDAPIAMLCFRPGFGQRTFPDRLQMTRRLGIPGERWLTHPWLRLPDGSPDPRIQVSLLPTRVLDLIWQDRKTTVHPGDPIIADLDMTEANTPPGTLIQAGTAVLRVSDERNDGCVKWKARHGDAAYTWITAPAHAHLRLRGLLCAVEQDGEVTLTDRLCILR